uniref:hypothetical protein n=1 Tax=Herbidospora sakaeratensis TaxID=564415 RepID=UPI0012FCA1A3|nr:hypothetical protein [Herbidospora sakaeratensis]
MDGAAGGPAADVPPGTWITGGSASSSDSWARSPKSNRPPLKTASSVAALIDEIARPA